MSPSDGHGGERLAPVTYLPGVAPVAAPRPRPTVSFTDSYWADGASASEAADATVTSFGARGSAAVDDDTDHDHDHDPDPDTDTDPETDRSAVVARASASLTRSLGRRGLSVAEARSKLRADGVSSDEVEDVIDDFLRRGWLDDAVLAEQIVHTSTTRQGMGTKAIRQLLQKRLVDREVIAAAVSELPDDDAERALEYAMSKARTLLRYDDETATRRLLGQLARRGFGGSAASQAVRTALAQARRDAGGGGVRFR